ncbi:hypothetical protein [Streptosporangium sandarakinum]|uniref:hypothetical protein n=1 Tax=Streptosporangium sandarakinum TaxID=1260955 RepID=UPI003445EDDD
MMRDMRASYEAGEAVGLTARPPDGETFANVLFHEERASVSLLPLLDHRAIAHMPEFVDLGWHLERFLAPFRDLPIVRTEAGEHR